MPCEEWSKCVRNYQKAVQAYADAVCNLGYGPGPDFSRSWQLAERNRINSDAARAALLDHEHAHNHACLAHTPSHTASRTSSEESRFAAESTEDLVLGDQGQSGG